MVLSTRLPIAQFDALTAACLAVSVACFPITGRSNRWEVSMLAQVLPKVGTSDVIAGARRRTSRLEVCNALIVTKLTVKSILASAILFA